MGGGRPGPTREDRHVSWPGSVYARPWTGRRDAGRVEMQVVPTLRETVSLPCVWTFAVCKFSSTRQTKHFSCVKSKTLGKIFIVCLDLRHTANNSPHPHLPTIINSHRLLPQIDTPPPSLPSPSSLRSASAPYSPACSPSPSHASPPLPPPLAPHR